MINIQNLTSSQLRKVLAIKERIEQLESELEAITGEESSSSAAVPVSTGSASKAGRRTMSPAARARIAAAQRARWAKVHAASGKKPAAKAPGGKGGKRRKMSPAVKAKLAAIARARWAKVKAAGKSAL
jgi:hypothetical protein